MRHINMYCDILTNIMKYRDIFCGWYFVYLSVLHTYCENVAHYI